MDQIDNRNIELASDGALDKDNLVFDVDINSMDATHNIQYDVVAEGISQIYDTTLGTYLAVRDLAYDRNTLINFGFDSFESICKKGQPIAQTLYNKLGQPVVKGIDYRVNSLIGKIELLSLPVAVSSQWLHDVDATLKQHIDVTQSIALFSRVSANIYFRLHNAALAANQNVLTPVLVKYEDFQEELKKTLRRSWSNNLVQVSEQAYQTLTSKVNDLKAKNPLTTSNIPVLIETTKQALKPLEQAVFGAFETHLQRPSYAFYNHCTDEFMKLAAKARETGQTLVPGDVTTFLDRIKAQLGGMYTAQLETPAKEFFEKAIQTNEALKGSGMRLLSAWNLDKGQMLLQDYFFRTQAAASNAKKSWLSYFGFGGSSEDKDATAAANSSSDNGESESVEVMAITAESDTEEEESEPVQAPVEDAPVEEESEQVQAPVEEESEQVQDTKEDKKEETQPQEQEQPQVEEAVEEAM